jgi:hypothetical protein
MWIKKSLKVKAKLLDPAAIGQAIERGVADFSTAFAVDLITAIDAGSPIVVLAGVHVGCYELFAKPDIRRITELEGKRWLGTRDPMDVGSWVDADLGSYQGE